MLKRRNKSKVASLDKRGEPINDDLCEVLKNSPIKLYTDKLKEANKKENQIKNHIEKSKSLKNPPYSFKNIKPRVVTSNDG